MVLVITRAKDIALEAQEDQSGALHDLYCRTRSEGFGEEVQVGITRHWRLLEVT